MKQKTRGSVWLHSSEKLEFALHLSPQCVLNIFQWNLSFVATDTVSRIFVTAYLSIATLWGGSLVQQNCTQGWHHADREWEKSRALLWRREKERRLSHFCSLVYITDKQLTVLLVHKGNIKTADWFGVLSFNACLCFVTFDVFRVRKEESRVDGYFGCLKQSREHCCIQE